MTTATAVLQERRGRGFEPVLFGLAAFVLYAALLQRAFYKTDGPDLLWLLEHGERHPWHVGYLPLLHGLRALLSPLGCSDFRIAGLYSALGAAVAVATLRAGLWQLGMPRTKAWLATALLACNPGTLRFATVVEFHAPFLGACGLAFLCTCVMAVRPRWWGMALLGVSTHAAFLMHATGIFLPVLLLALFLALRWRHGERRRDLRLAVLAGAVHAALFLLLPKLLPGFYGFHADMAQAAAVEGSIGRDQSLANTFEILVQEWVPLQPLAFAVLVAFVLPRCRREALALLLGFLPFLYWSVRQLKDEPEHGAYLLPVLLPAARLVALALPSPLSIALVLWSLVSAFWQVGLEEQATWQGYQAWHRSLLAAADGRPPYVIVGRHEEMGMAKVLLRPDEFFYIRDAAAMPPAELPPALLAAVDQQLAAKLASGAAVLLSAGGLAMLQDPQAALQAETPHRVVAKKPRAGPELLAHLQQAFRFVPHAGGVVQLLPR